MLAFKQGRITRVKDPFYIVLGNLQSCMSLEDLIDHNL